MQLDEKLVLPQVTFFTAKRMSPRSLSLLELPSLEHGPYNLSIDVQAGDAGDWVSLESHSGLFLLTVSSTDSTYLCKALVASNAGVEEVVQAPAFEF